MDKPNAKLVKKSFEILGKNKPMDYSPLKEKNRKKMMKADSLEQETLIQIEPLAYEDGVSPKMRDKIMSKVESNRQLVKRLRMLK